MTARNSDKPNLGPFDLVHALGGPVQVGERLGLSPSSVCNWYDAAGGIPPRHHLALWRMAQEARVDWRPPGADGLKLVAA